VSIRKHAKDPSMFYGSESRQEMADFELRYAEEANKGIVWAALRGFEDTSPVTSVELGPYVQAPQ
jgi:hypothetical protein